MTSAAEDRPGAGGDRAHDPASRVDAGYANHWGESPPDTSGRGRYVHGGAPRRGCRGRRRDRIRAGLFHHLDPLGHRYRRHGAGLTSNRRRPAGACQPARSPGNRLGSSVGHSRLDRDVCCGPDAHRSLRRRARRDGGGDDLSASHRRDEHRALSLVRLWCGAARGRRQSHAAEGGDSGQHCECHRRLRAHFWSLWATGAWCGRQRARRSGRPFLGRRLHAGDDGPGRQGDLAQWETGAGVRTSPPPGNY